MKNLPLCFLDFANKIKFLSNLSLKLDPIEIPINYECLKGVFKGYKNIEYDWVFDKIIFRYQ